MFPVTGTRGHNPEAHEFTEGSPALLRHHHCGQQQPDIQRAQSGACCLLTILAGPVPSQPVPQASSEQMSTHTVSCSQRCHCVVAPSKNKFFLYYCIFVQVSMLYSSAVVCDLLQSCYTGVLQFSPEEIVNYLTAASYLQMEHIVQRCRGALKKFMQLRNPSPQKASNPKPSF